MATNSKKFIIAGIIGGIVAFALLVGLIGQGGVRHVQIFYPEQVKQTVAFQEEGGGVKLVGISGIGEDDNPTLIMRVSFEYVLTVINHGTTFHRLYIDGVEVQTDLLAPGEQDIITIYPKEEGTYNYYDKRQTLELLGHLRAVKVVQSDIFD